MSLAPLWEVELIYCKRKSEIDSSNVFYLKGINLSTIGANALEGHTKGVWHCTLVKDTDCDYYFKKRELHEKGNNKNNGKKMQWEQKGCWQ